MTLFKRLLVTERHMKGNLTDVQELRAWAARTGPTHANLELLLADIEGDLAAALSTLGTARKVEKIIRELPE